MASSTIPGLVGEFTSAVLAACPPEQWARSGALCALLDDRGDHPQPRDSAAVEAELRAQLEQHPTDLETLCALDRLHGDRASLIEILQRRRDLAVDHDERWALLVRLGLLHIVASSSEGVQSVIDALAPLRIRAGERPS